MHFIPNFYKIFIFLLILCVCFIYGASQYLPNTTRIFHDCGSTMLSNDPQRGLLRVSLYALISRASLQFDIRTEDEVNIPTFYTGVYNDKAYFWSMAICYEKLPSMIHLYQCEMCLKASVEDLLNVQCRSPIWGLYRAADCYFRYSLLEPYECWVTPID